MRKILFFLLFSIIVGPSFVIAQTECWKEYCWNSKNEMFLTVEKVFNDDYKLGNHNKNYGFKGNCEFNLSSIAYGFAKSETDLGNKGIGKVNNWYGIRKGTGKYQPMREESMGMYEGHLAYPSPFLSTYDFMYLIKYGYNCQLTKDNLFKYVGWENEGYINNVLSSVKYFEKFYNTNFYTIQNLYSRNQTDNNLYFSNKGINIKIENGNDISILTYPDFIDIKSQYSDLNIDINYKKCDESNKLICDFSRNLMENYKEDSFVSYNGIKFYKIPNQNSRLFFKPGKYIYYIDNISKFELLNFSKFIYFPNLITKN